MTGAFDLLLQRVSGISLFIIHFDIQVKTVEDFSR